MQPPLVQDFESSKTCIFYKMNTSSPTKIHCIFLWMQGAPGKVPDLFSITEEFFSRCGHELGRLPPNSTEEEQASNLHKIHQNQLSKPYHIQYDLLSFLQIQLYCQANWGCRNYNRSVKDLGKKYYILLLWSSQQLISINSLGILSFLAHFLVFGQNYSPENLGLFIA